MKRKKAAKIIGCPTAWLLSKAKAYRRLRQDTDALNLYDRLIEIYPFEHKAWYGRGMSLKRLERYEEALVSYDNAINIKPDYCKAWSAKGDLLYKLKRHEEALTCYDKAVESKSAKYKTQ